MQPILKNFLIVLYLNDGGKLAVAHRGNAVHFLNLILSRNKRETCQVARDRLSRTLFPWTTITAIVEEVCFEVNKSFYFREKIIWPYFAIPLRHSSVNQYSKS